MKFPKSSLKTLALFGQSQIEVPWLGKGMRGSQNGLSGWHISVISLMPNGGDDDDDNDNSGHS